MTFFLAGDLRAVVWVFVDFACFAIELFLQLLEFFRERLTIISQANKTVFQELSGGGGFTN